MDTVNLTNRPRIPPVAEPDEPQAEALSKAPRLPSGQVRNIFLTLAHHPLLLKRFNCFAGTFMAFGVLSDYERELAILRVAGATGSRYEYCQHLPIARAASLSDATILAVMGQPGAAALSPADELIVRAADELLAGGNVTQQTWAELAARFDSQQLLELLFTVGFYRMVGDILNTVGVELEDAPDLTIDWAEARRACSRPPAATPASGPGS